MNVTRRHAIRAMVAVILLGLVVAWSGVLSVGASSGHWAVTDWFLHWAMRNSARTQSALTVDEPATDFSGLVSAAGHFAVSCAPCHGAPGERALTVVQAAAPPPPDLATTVDTYRDRELFWVIKHGVKFTAMPAWPAQDRDDEVRRMAAFVRRLPRMSATEYRALAHGPGRVSGGAQLDLQAALADCERCHADDGRAQPDIPVLAGQKADYLLSTLQAYASGRRSSAVMSAAAARVDPRLLRALADHYAALPGLDADRDVAAGAARAARRETDRDTYGEAARIVVSGLPRNDLPACAECHSAGKRPDYPVIAGQKAEYLAARLRRWRAGSNVVDARKSRLTMPVIARRIPESMIDPLANYFASQPAESPAARP
jgi:cytochrome c553